MAKVSIQTRIHAPRAKCFDLARDVEAHVRTSDFTNERAVAPGRTSGLLELGDLVTFEGTHFGLRLRLSARIVEMQPPTRFVDEVVRSPFRSMRHTHVFTEDGPVTVMRDEIEWSAPLGVLGTLADRVFLERYLRRFIVRKQEALKVLAEADA